MATKRRAGHAASPDLSTPDPAKRIRKRNDDTHFPDHEDVETTQELGGKILRLLRKSTDKNGRVIATNFLDLPDRDEYPDYYQHILMPLSLNIIEEKLNDGTYDTMEKLESDLKRMVQNAKDYNDSKSPIFEDAERIRKALSNFMPKHNPAYLNEDYRAYPTPIPQALLDRRAAESPAPTNGTGPVEGGRLKLVLNKNVRRRQSQPVSTDGDDASVDHESTFLALLDELSEQEHAINFEEKPSKREVPDYYKIIQHPTAINDVRRMVQRGKITDWTTLAKEVRLIWDNAKEYNEPGSEIYEMAESLDNYFEAKLQGSGGQPRVSTKITLSAPRPKQLKLKMGSTTPTLPPAVVPGTTVDSEALRRQKEETMQALTRSTRGASRGYTNGTTPVPAIPTSLRRSVSISDHTLKSVSVNGNGVAQAQSLQPIAMPAPPPGPTHLPTPAVMIEQLQPPFAVNGVQQPAQVVQPPRNIYSDSDNPIERKYRDPGKGLEDALLGSVTYMTHPNLPNDPKWKLSRYAHPEKTQTSYCIYLPHDHAYLRLIPTLTAELKTRRNHKMIVTHDWNAVSPAPSMQLGGPFYDFGLHPGENTVAVDVIADLKLGERKDYAPPQLQVDFERITFYIFLRERDG